MTLLHAQTFLPIAFAMWARHLSNWAGVVCLSLFPSLLQASSHFGWPRDSASGLTRSLLFSHELRFYETDLPENIPPGDSVAELESRLLWCGRGFAVDPSRFGMEISSLILLTLLVVKVLGNRSRIEWLTCSRLIVVTVIWIALVQIGKNSSQSAMSGLGFLVGWVTILSFFGNMILSAKRGHPNFQSRMRQALKMS